MCCAFKDGEPIELGAKGVQTAFILHGKPERFLQKAALSPVWAKNTISMTIHYGHISASGAASWTIRNPKSLKPFAHRVKLLYTGEKP
jgi:hypothetical protein